MGICWIIVCEECKEYVDVGKIILTPFTRNELKMQEYTLCDLENMNAAFGFFLKHLNHKLEILNDTSGEDEDRYFEVIYGEQLSKMDMDYNLDRKNSKYKEYSVD